MRTLQSLNVSAMIKLCRGAGTVSYPGVHNEFLNEQGRWIKLLPRIACSNLQ